MLEGFLGQPRGQGCPLTQVPGAPRGPRASAPAPSPGQGPALTGEDLEGEGVLLLDGVGEVETCVAAVVRLHVLEHHVREIQVAVVALGDTLVLGDGLHGWKGAEVQTEVSGHGNRSDRRDSSGDGVPTESRWCREFNVIPSRPLSSGRGFFPVHR